MKASSTIATTTKKREMGSPWDKIQALPSVSPLSQLSFLDLGVLDFKLVLAVLADL